MYKRRLFLCLLILGTLTSRAQISMTLQVPPIGVLVKNQLWNMLLVNSSNKTLMIRINMVLLDEKTNQPVLTGTTLPFALDKGARQIQAKDLGPIEYTYNGPVLADRDANGLLPIGNYQACYTVFTTTKSSALVENCIQLAVDPLSPPLLNTPADEGKIFTDYPQFTWLPPTPIGLFGDLSYDLVLVEVLPGQGKADAIQQNIPIYSGGFIRNLYLNYPSSYRSLDTAHLYAWRIVAMNNGLPAAMSEIWTFRVAPPLRLLAKTASNAYIGLKRGLDASAATSGSTLKITYDNIPADTVVNYTITSLDDPGNPVVQSGSVRLDKGHNFLDITLQRNGGWVQRKIYLFRFVNSRNEEWTVKFIWNPKNGQ